MKGLIIIYRGTRVLYIKVAAELSTWLTRIKLYANFASVGTGLRAKGVPLIYVKRTGRLTIGRNFSVNSGLLFNAIGGQDRSTFSVYSGAELSIGDNVGISNTSIVCYQKVTIEDYVKIGGSVKIYDTNFHSLNPAERNQENEVYSAAKAEVIIREGAFIGAHTIILKGSIIGKNAVIGAGSVVSGTIPNNEIWAGNPARFIQSLNTKK